MGNYQGYQKYKDSGVEWLGDIPEHWEVKRLKQITKLIDGDRGKNYPNENDLENDGIPFLSTDNIKSNAFDFSSKTKFITLEKFESLSRGKLIKNDLVVTMRGTIGQTALFSNVPYQTAFINAQMIIVRPINIFAKFLKYISMSVLWSKQLDFYSYGTAQQQLSGAFLGVLYLGLPPLHEQQKIAQFLDYKTKQIDQLIKKKETLIEKLDEKRTALISHAVTKGLDSSVPMKDSGIEWLGDIPKHWEVKRLRYTGSCQNGISKGADYFGYGYPFVNYTDVYANIELPKIVSGLANSTDMDRINYSVQKGDIFFTRTSETIEEIGITSTCLNSINNATFSGFLIRVRPFPHLLFTGFSKYYFRCQLHRFFFVKEMNLVTRASLSQELLKRLPVLLPSLEEQKQIAEYLDKKTTQIDLQKAKIKQAIELLKEYRTSLITNAVTGKIDVRQIAIP
jgi:type I restriction enzyme S subunit